MAATLTIGAGANNYSSDEASFAGQTNRLANLSQLQQLLYDDSAAANPSSETWTVDQNGSGQVVATITDAASETFHILVQGGSLPQDTTTITGGYSAVLAAIDGTVTGFQVVDGGTYDSGSQTIIGGTPILSGTVSAGAWILSTPAVGGGSITATVTGVNLPTSFTAFEQILTGTYSGSTFEIFSYKLSDNGVTIGEMEFPSQSGSDTFTWGTSAGSLETLSLNGTVNNSFTAAQINGLPFSIFPTPASLFASLLPTAVPSVTLLPVVASNVTGFTLTDLASGKPVATLTEAGTGVPPGANGTTYQASLGGGTIDASATKAIIRIGFGTGNGFLQIGGTFAPAALGVTAPDPVSGGRDLEFYPGGVDPGTVIGGSGFNVASFNFAASNYTVTLIAGGATVTPNTPAYNGTSVITLKNFEELDFSDGTVVRFRRPGENFIGTTTSDILLRNTVTHQVGIDVISHAAVTSFISLGAFGDNLAIKGSGDFNGDGTSDLLILNKTTGAWSIDLVQDGAIADTTSLGAPGSSWQVVGRGDFNGDATTDILWRNSSSNDTGIALMNNGTAAGWTDLGTIDSSWSVAGVGYFGGANNKYQDILFRNANGATGIDMFGGAGSITSWVSLGTLTTDWSVLAVGNFAGGGQADILWRNTTSGDVGVELLNSSGAFTAWKDLGIVGSNWSFAQVGDFNSDGTTDILWRNTQTGEAGIDVMSNGTIGSWASLGTVGLQWSTSAGAVVRRAQTADYNADATSDILWRSASSGDTGIGLMGNGAVTGWSDLGTIASTWSIIGSGDFNGDGTSDILLQDASGNLGIDLIGNGAITGSTSLGSAAPGWSVVGIGDFNGDGTQDLLWGNAAAGSVGIGLMTNGANSGWADLGPVASGWSVAGVGDYNGDGTADILWRNTSGQTGIDLMSNGAVTGWSDLGTIATNWSVLGSGDFTGNGIADILWRNATNGDVGIGLMSNSGTVTQWSDLGVIPAGWTVQQIGDFNGDGTSDILWRNANGSAGIDVMANGAVSGWASLGTTSTDWSIQKTGPTLGSA